MTQSSYGFVRWDQYLALPDQEETWILEPLVPSGGLVNLYGKPKQGKSLLALGMALAIGNPTQAEWLGFPVHRHGPVAYFQADTPRSIWKGNHLKHVAAAGYTGDVWMSDPYLMPYPFDIMEPGNVETLQGMIQALPFQPLVVIVDTIREIHSLDENSSTEMRKVFGALRVAADPAAIVLIGHSKKSHSEDTQSSPDESGHAEDVMEEGRGSGYLAGKMDTVMKLTRCYLHYHGRATGRERRRIQQNSCYLWELADTPAMKGARELVTQHESSSTRTLAKALATQLRISPEAARSTIRRQRHGTRVAG